MCIAPEKEDNPWSIPSMRSMMKSARRKDRLVDFKRARQLDSRSFSKGYRIANSAIVPLRFIKREIMRKNPEMSSDVANRTAEKEYEKLMNKLGPRHAGYRNAFVNIGDNNKNAWSKLSSNIEDHYDTDIGLPLMSIMPMNAADWSPADFYGAPFQVNDGLDNWGKKPVFDVGAWKNSNAESRIRDVIDSSRDPKPKVYFYNGSSAFLPGGIENILA